MKGNILDFSNWKLVMMEVIKNEEYIGNRTFFVYSDNIDVEALGEDKEVVKAFINSGLGSVTRSDPEDVEHDIMYVNKKLINILNNADEDNYLDWLYDEVDTDGQGSPHNFSQDNFVVVSDDNSIKQLDEELYKLMY